MNISSYDNEVEHHNLRNGIEGLISVFKQATAADSEGIGFVSLWSHGVPGGIFDGGDWSTNIIGSDNLEPLKYAVDNGNINFADGAIIYLGACNAGTDDSEGISFAQKLANITGAIVVAARNDKVGPADESKGNMIYTTYYPKKNQFNKFEKNKKPEAIGGQVDVMHLLSRSKNNTNGLNKMESLNTWNDAMSIINSWLQQNPKIEINFSN
jgi:hypothetical protein